VPSEDSEIPSFRLCLFWGVVVECLNYRFTCSNVCSWGLVKQSMYMLKVTYQADAGMSASDHTFECRRRDPLVSSQPPPDNMI
jgi:hypothetical protein